MKQLFTFLTIATFLFVAGCSKEEVDDRGDENKPQQPTITLDSSASNFTTGGGSNTITFTASEAWTAEVINTRADAWCSIQPTSGAAGNAKITITTTANDTPDDRSATINIKAGNTTKTIIVSQKQKDALTITASKFEVEAKGGEITIEVKANIDFEYAIDEAAKEWIKQKGTRAMKTSTLTFSIAENDDTKKREGKILIKSGELNETVTIYQAGSEPVIVISKNEYVVSSNGETIAVEVKSNVDVAVELPSDADWISENATRSISTNTYHFDIQPNESHDQREAGIKFTNKENGLSETVKVVQAQKDALIVAKESYTVSNEGTQIQIEVGHNVDFDIEISDDWISKAETRTFETETLTFNIAKNTGYDNREGTVIFKLKNSTLSQTVKIYQAQEDAIVLAKSEYEFGMDGGNLDFEIQTNVDISVAISDNAKDWISQVETRALESKSLYFNIVAYDAKEDRVGTITITGGNAAQTITVTQHGKTEINPDEIPDNEIWYTTTNGNTISLISNVEGRPDSKFNAQVVSNIYKNGKGVIKFDAPVTEICEYSFAIKYDLVSIYLPKSINFIGVDTFYDCYNLKEVVINSEDLTIGGEGNLFRGCKSLQKIGGPLASEDERCLIVNNSLYYFAPYDITEYVIPQGVKIIKGASFIDSKLKKITISEGVETIEREAFIGPSYTDDKIESSLEYVYLPSTLKSMHTYAFIYNKNIKAFYGDNEFVSPDGMCLTVNYPGGNKTIVSFASGANLTEYTVPEGVGEIAAYGFYYATSLRKLNFPDSFNTIYVGQAFEGTTNIETITGKYVLDDNRSMVVDSTLIMYAGAGLEKYVTPKEVKHLGYQVLGYNNSIKEYVISDVVTEVDSFGYIFSQCPNLETVTISANMRYLGYDPFNATRFATPQLKKVYCRAIIPPIVYYNNFDGYYDFNNLVIYVPEESLDVYKSSLYWEPYRKYLKGFHYTDLPKPDYYISTDYSADSKVTTLQTATKGNGIDIVLMGDAYSDRQIADGTYKTDMEYIYNNLFTEEPYKSFKDYFNVHYVNVVSATEGYEYGNTALNSFFGGGTYVGGNDNAVVNYALNVLSEAKVDEALLIVAMNSDNYAGTCYMYGPTSTTGTYGSGLSIAYFPKGGNAETFAQLLHHEACGHGFAKLADEYAYEDMGAAPADYVSQTKEEQNNWGWWKNVDFTSDPSAIRWSHFINDTRYANEGLGAYEGGLTYWTGVWRPTENSIMRYNTGGFNAPSREAIYYRIHKLAYGDSWEYNYEDFVAWDARNRTAAATRAQSYKPANYKPTHPPVIVNKSWRDAK